MICMINFPSIPLAGFSISYTNCIRMCLMRQRSDPDQGGRIRWALPLDQQMRCHCTTIIAAHNHISDTPGDTPCKPDSSAYWFTDDYEMITNPELRGTTTLKCLIDCPCEGKVQVWWSNKLRAVSR